MQNNCHGAFFFDNPFVNFLGTICRNPLCAPAKGGSLPPQSEKNKNLPQKLSTKSLTNRGRRRSVRLRRFGKDAGARERRGKVKKLLDRRREIFIKTNFAVADSFAGRRKKFSEKRKKKLTSRRGKRRNASRAERKGARFIDK